MIAPLIPVRWRTAVAVALKCFLVSVWLFLLWLCGSNLSLTRDAESWCTEQTPCIHRCGCARNPQCSQQMRQLAQKEKRRRPQLNSCWHKQKAGKEQLFCVSVVFEAIQSDLQLLFIACFKSALHVSHVIKNETYPDYCSKFASSPAGIFLYEGKIFIAVMICTNEIQWSWFSFHFLCASAWTDSSLTVVCCVLCRKLQYRRDLYADGSEPKVTQDPSWWVLKLSHEILWWLGRSGQGECKYAPSITELAEV